MDKEEQRWMDEFASVPNQPDGEAASFAKSRNSKLTEESHLSSTQAYK